MGTEKFNKPEQLWEVDDSGGVAACAAHDGHCVFIQADNSRGSDAEICLNVDQARKLRDWLTSALPTGEKHGEG